MTTPETEGALFGKKVPNSYKVDYDAPGFCALCHAEVAEFEGSVGNFPIAKKLLGNYRRTYFALDDGSSCQVTLCVDCAEGMKPADTGRLMESLINGWSVQTYSYLHFKEQWTPEKRDAYMDRYARKTIEGRLDRPWTLEDGFLKPGPNKKNIKRELSADLKSFVAEQAKAIRTLEGKE